MAAGRRRSHGGESRPNLTSRIVRNSVVLVVLAVFGLAVLWTFMSDGDEGETYTYSQLLDDVAARADVESITQEGTTPHRRTRRRRDASKTTTVASADINYRAEVCAAAGDPASCGGIELRLRAAQRGRRHPDAADHRPPAGPADRRLHLLHDAPGAGHQ